jgi:hypothetical protein
VPLRNTINGQLWIKFITLGYQIAISFSNCALYSGDNFSSESNIEPTLLPYNLYIIFLSVCVNIAVGVFSTSNFLKVYGHF